MIYFGLLIVLALILMCLVVVWLATHIRYRISPTHLQVLLFGFPFRQIKLSDIRTVSKRRPPGFSEAWPNAIHPSHRTLVIRRSRGWPRNFVITPRNRYVFKADLERAMALCRNPEGIRPEERVSIVSD